MRRRLLTRLFELTASHYAARKSQKPWNLSPSQLQDFPDGSLGRALGDFLAENGFELGAAGPPSAFGGVNFTA